MTARTRAAGAALAVLVVLAAGGCMSEPDPKESAGRLQDTRATVIQAIQRVGHALSREGGRVTEARGAFAVCGSKPTTSMEYRAAGKLAGDGPLTDRLRTAAEALKAEGWKVTEEHYDGDRPWANLEKDGLQLSLRKDALRSSDALSYGITGECLRVRDEQVADFDRSDTIAPAG